ncbi:MAG: hypothetical protein PHE06_03590 [Lachnospiraceae bacterium]|nr:hypothetical protein [Lachnospiraceae bacterium]MDD3795047.1 hypothetical protein [Lachnospiraceae bacterium]
MNVKKMQKIIRTGVVLAGVMGSGLVVSAEGTTISGEEFLEAQYIPTRMADCTTCDCT